MIRQYIQITLLTGALIGRLASVALAERAPNPISLGVVTTITVINAKTGMATLLTEHGEVFEVWKGWRWKAGDKVECDRIDAAPRPWLQNCKPWQ